MKYAAALLTASLLGLTGCVGPAVTIAPTPMRSGDAPASLVHADQVTPQSAQKIAQSLADELDREAQREIAATPKQ